MMYLVYILCGVLVICGMLFAADLFVRAWERAESRRAPRHPVYAAAHRSVPHLRVIGGLPDRDQVNNIYSLADQFADRFREVVNS